MDAGKAAASEEAKAYAFRYVEPLSAARTKRAVIFNILGERIRPLATFPLLRWH